MSKTGFHVVFPNLFDSHFLDILGQRVYSVISVLKLSVIMIFLLLFSTLFLSYCKADLPEGAVGPSKDFDKSMNDFTQDFLAAAGKNGVLGNFVFSPLSLHSTIAMLVSGADNDTDTQSELIGLFGSFGRISEIEDQYGNFVKLYNHFKSIGSKTNLEYGNRLYTTKTYFQNVSTEYLEKIDLVYDATLRPFADENPEGEINDWVNDLTKGRIDRIVESVSDSAFLLVNAIYFKASWAKEFEDEDVPQRRFTMLNGKSTRKLVKMIARRSKKQVVGDLETKWVEGDSNKTKVIALPYLSPDPDNFPESRYEMVFIVPEHYGGLLALQLNSEKCVDSGNCIEDKSIIGQAIEAIDANRGFAKDFDITMPEFTIDTDVAVKKYFQDLGVEAAFEEGGFGGIIPKIPLKVSSIKHRATIEITKKGTVGAAATAVELVALSGQITEPEVIVIDRPFLFFVRDIQLHAIVFAGKVTNPLK